MSRREIKAKEIRWTVYNEDDPNQILGEDLTGKQCDALMARLRKRCINTAAIMTY